MILRWAIWLDPPPAASTHFVRLFVLHQRRGDAHVIPSRGLGLEFCLQTPELFFPPGRMVPSRAELLPQVVLETFHQHSRVRSKRLYTASANHLFVIERAMDMVSMVVPGPSQAVASTAAPSFINSFATSTAVGCWTPNHRQQWLQLPQLEPPWSAGCPPCRAKW